MLDIGCGNKPFQGIFFKVTGYVGCDIVPSDQNVADLLCDSTNIALADNSFDTVLSTQVIEHVEEPQKLCDEAFRLLKSGGHFILSGPMYWHLHEEPFDFYRFTIYGFRYMLERSGFDIIEIIPCGGKWAFCGLVTVHTIEGTWLFRRPVVWLINRFFSWMDDRNKEYRNTSNYVVIAQKPA